MLKKLNVSKLMTKSEDGKNLDKKIEALSNDN